MAKIAVEETFDVSKTALMRDGAKEWIADQEADALAKSESVENRICEFSICKFIGRNLLLIA